MIAAINIFFAVVIAICLFGMIGEQRDMELKRGLTNGFIITLIGLVILNAIYFM